MNPVDDFLKTAGWLGTFKIGFGHALGAAGVGALLAGGGMVASKGYDAVKERITKPRDYQAMLKANPAVEKYDAGQVQMVYNSLRAQSPSMSKDPLIANSFVRRTLDLATEDGPYIDPATAKTLAETQRNVAQAKSARGSIADAFKPIPMYPMNPDPFDNRKANLEERKFQAQQAGNTPAQQKPFTF